MYFFVGLLTLTTYTLAGWAREQVCTYMCPWPRFQSAMLDEHSLIVTYEGWRGEPRGKLRSESSSEPRGDCIDCRLCVNVCPTGIDIRDGQQIECIGCSLCVDACNATMLKIGRPQDLIRWDTLAAQQARRTGATVVWRPVRPRTILYAALLSVVLAVVTTAFFLRAEVYLSVQRDRNPNFVRLSDGDVRNSYAVKISNKRQSDAIVQLGVNGLPGALLTVTNSTADPVALPHLFVRADSVGTFRVLITVPAASSPSGSAPIHFFVTDENGHRPAEHDAVFVGPHR